MTDLLTVSLRDGYRLLANWIDPVVAALPPTNGIDKNDPRDALGENQVDLKHARNIWLHLLHGLYQGHIVSRIVESSHLWELIDPRHWPDVSVYDSYDFSELRTMAKLHFDYGNSEGRYRLANNKTIIGRIELDSFSFDNFSRLFTPRSVSSSQKPDTLTGH